MKYTITAHPTMYRGVQYRSRLEARYAAFFDLLGWSFQYEPIDLRGWSPDFALIGARETILVEIKPYTQLSEAQEAMDKIQRALGEDMTEAALFGNFLNGSRDFCAPTCGWLCERFRTEDDGVVSSWADAIITPVTSDKDVESYGLIHATGSYGDRISGYGDGDHHLFAKNLSISDVYTLWASAGNAVQWKPQ